MPLKIIPPRNAKTKNLYIRGTYLGIAVDKSCGTDRRSVARTILKRLEGEIERGEYPPREIPSRPGEPTFLSAALAYMEAGRNRRYVARLIKHFGEMPLGEVDQGSIDEAAVALYPDATGATRNRCVYTPVSSILRNANVKVELRRPKGSKGRTLTDWLSPPDAFGIVEAAERFDPEIATLLRFLLYTGVRLGAALNLQREDIRLDESAAWVRHQKGQPASDVRLRDDLRDALATHLATHDRRRVFRLRQGGHLKHQLVRAKLGYLGLPCPVRRPKGWRPPPYRLAWVNYHSFRHTWASWCRQYARATVDDLVDSGNWKDPRSARRYVHAVAHTVWENVNMLPSMKKV